MADYKSLGTAPMVVAADTTGLNPGNWTGTIVLATAVSYLADFECYHVAIDGPVGFELSWFIDNKKWSHTAQGWANEWDPQQPALLNSGQTLFFFWTAPITTSPTPTGTAWFRYDTALKVGGGL